MSRPKYELIKSLVNDAIPDSVRLSGNNTLTYDLDGGGNGVQLHDTEIIRFLNDGSIILNSGGYKTMTTKARINELLPQPWNLYQEDGVWYLSNWNDSKVYVFQDGITINPDGTVSNDGVDPKKLQCLRKKILQYSKDYIKALMKGNVPAPSNGDCWYCLMRDNAGKTLGELSNDNDHLKKHMQGKYFVPSLLVRAIEVFPVSMAARWKLGQLWGEESDQAFDAWDNIASEQLQSSLKRYLYRQFSLPA